MKLFPPLPLSGKEWGGLESHPGNAAIGGMCPVHAKQPSRMHIGKLMNDRHLAAVVEPFA